MKKILIIAAFAAAVVCLDSCQKEPFAVNENTVGKGPVVFTATIANDQTKTTLNTTTGKMSWEGTEVITITDAASNEAKYTISSFDGSKATLVKSTGDDLTTPPYTATYGQAPAYTQLFSTTVKDIPMTATSSSDPATATDLAFHATAGLLKMSLTHAAENISKVAVTSTTKQTYALYCETAQSIAAGVDFYIALPAGDYDEFRIYDNAEKRIVLIPKSAGNKTTIAANTIQTLSFATVLDPSDFDSDSRPAGSYGTALVNSASGRSFCEWVQLWAGGPKFATFNVGSTIYDYQGQTEYTAATCGGLYGWHCNELDYRNGIFSTTDYTSASKVTNLSASVWGSNWYDPPISVLYKLLNFDSDGSTPLDPAVTSVTWVEATGTSLAGFLISGVDTYANNSIFLPAGGSGNNVAAVKYLGTGTRLWSSDSGEGVNLAYKADGDHVDRSKLSECEAQLAWTYRPILPYHISISDNTCSGYYSNSDIVVAPGTKWGDLVATIENIMTRGDGSFGPSGGSPNAYICYPGSNIIHSDEYVVDGAAYTWESIEIYD